MSTLSFQLLAPAGRCVCQFESNMDDPIGLRPTAPLINRLAIEWQTKTSASYWICLAITTHRRLYSLAFVYERLALDWLAVFIFVPRLARDLTV